MKLTLEINNQTKYKFTKIFFQKIFAHTLLLADKECLLGRNPELSIAIVSGEEIRAINDCYRGRNKATDVLSFSEYESVEELCLASKEKNLFIGELILCPDYITKNAEEDGETMEYALTYITAHGILHLLGLAHGKKMFSLQRQVADELMKK